MAEPTLPELLRSSRYGRVLGIALAVVALAVVALFLLGRSESFSYAGNEAPPFSLSWGSDLAQAEAGPADLLLLEGESESLSVQPLEGGGSLPELALAGERVRSEIEGEYPGARVVREGRTELAVDRGPDAYQLAFVAPEGDENVVIGKRFLVPDPDRPGEGVEIEITERTANPRVIEKVEEAPAGFFGSWPIQLLLEDAASVRTSDVFEEPLRSFSFG